MGAAPIPDSLPEPGELPPELQAFAHRAPTAPRGPGSPIQGPHVNWLFVDLNSYFASVEQQVRPELRGRPVGVVPAMVDTTCCIAASYEAKAFGVRTGTLVGDARKMCPEIVLVEGRHDLYTEVHHSVVEAVESCVPVTAVCSIDEMACRLLGRERPLLAALDLGRRVKRTIAERVGECLRSSVGLATSRYLAKVASDMEKPDGLVALTLDMLPEALRHLSLRDLPGIGAKTEMRLNEKGIHTMDELLALGCEQTGQLWGSVWGERLWHWLRGEDFEMAEHEELKSLSHQHVLAPEMRNPENAYAVAHKLLHKAAMRLRSHGLWAGSIGLAIGFAHPRLACGAAPIRVPRQSHADRGAAAAVGIAPVGPGFRPSLFHRREPEQPGPRPAALAQPLRRARRRAAPHPPAGGHGRAEQQIWAEHAGARHHAGCVQSRAHADCIPQHPRNLLRIWQRTAAWDFQSSLGAAM